MVFPLVNGNEWRSHLANAFQYYDGSWQQVETLIMPPLDVLTATEGLFISLSEVDNIQWNWYDVKSSIEDIFCKYEDETTIFQQ